MPFDIPMVELMHSAGNCTFDSVIKKYNIEDSAVVILAKITMRADTDQYDLAPQVA